MSDAIILETLAGQVEVDLGAGSWISIAGPGMGAHFHPAWLDAESPEAGEVDVYTNNGCIQLKFANPSVAAEALRRLRSLLPHVPCETMSSGHACDCKGDCEGDCLFEAAERDLAGRACAAGDKNSASERSSDAEI